MSDLANLPALTLATHPTYGQVLYDPEAASAGGGLPALLLKSASGSGWLYVASDELTDFTPVRLVPEGHVVLDPASAGGVKALAERLLDEFALLPDLPGSAAFRVLQGLAERQAEIRATAANPEPEGLGINALAIHPETDEVWRRDALGAWLDQDQVEHTWADTGLTDADIKWRGEGA